MAKQDPTAQTTAEPKEKKERATPQRRPIFITGIKAFDEEGRELDVHHFGGDFDATRDPTKVLHEMQTKGSSAYIMLDVNNVK